MSSRVFEVTAAAKAEPAPARQTEAPESAVASGRSLDVPTNAGGDPRAQATALARASGGRLSRAGGDLLQLQRGYGNHHMQRVVDHARTMPVIQPKLILGPADDQYEREADRLAQEVTGQVAQRPAAAGTETGCVMRKPTIQPLHGAQGGVVDAGAQQAIEQAGGGQAIPDHVRAPMEQGIGADFSGVRVHTNAQADQLNRALQARAFTTGQDIFFRRGAYDPGSRGGQALIAHELTHVIQQQPRETAYRASDREISSDQVTPVGQQAGMLLQGVWSWGRAAIGALGIGAAGALIGGLARGPLGALVVGGLGLVAGGIAGGLFGGTTEDQTLVEPEDQFPRRAQERVGVGEKVKLSVQPTVSAQHMGQLEWVLLSGIQTGTLGPTNDRGEAEFVAGATAGLVKLRCRHKLSGQEFGNPTFQIVEPNAGRVEQQQGTNIWHKPGLWHVAFLANLYVLPDDVSFSAIEFQEGAAPAQINGPWQAQRSNHAAGRDETIFPPSALHGVNKVKTTDWVQSGTYAYNPNTHPGGASSFVWHIPWYYKLQGTTKEFTKIDHEAQDDGNGLARIQKDGSGWFEARVTDGASWPFTPAQDIESIEDVFPGQMNAQMEQFLLNNLVERTEIVSADKEGHYPQGMTLQEAIDIELDIGKIFNYCPTMDSDTIGRIRKMPRAERQQLVNKIDSGGHNVTPQELNKAIDAELGI